MRARGSQVIAIAAILLSTLTQAHAGAAIVSHEGVVMVNNGSGYRPASGSMSLVTGDRVLVTPKSKALLGYADGCMVPVNAGRLVTISRVSPCSVKAACTAQTAGACSSVLANGFGSGTGLVGGALPAVGTALGVGVITSTIISSSQSGGDKTLAVSP
ncbi:MAG: hypothetical protein AB7F96_09705 [Beijerinckiaceae bacterium]